MTMGFESIPTQSLESIKMPGYIYRIIYKIISKKISIINVLDWSQRDISYDWDLITELKIVSLGPVPDNNNGGWD